MMRNKEWTLLLLILALAFFLRFWRIDQNPPSLNWDEVSHGYNAYSILETGKDEWGVKFPTIFRAYGDYKLPVYIYLTVVSEKIFGLNEFAVRFPSVIAGVLGVLGAYFLAKELFLSRQGKTLRVENLKPEGLPCVAKGYAGGERNWRGIPLIAAFLLAVDPWGLFLSRVAMEANVALFLIIAGAVMFLRGLKSPRLLFFSSLFFGLSLFTYNSARVFVPLLVGSLVGIYRGGLYRGNKGNKGVKVVAGLVFLVFFGVMLISVLSASGQARYQWVALLDEGAISQINQNRGESGLPGILPVAFYNKGTYLATQVAKNYISHFLPHFLFFKGGSHYQFNIPNFGLLYPVNAPFILIGFWYLLKNRSRVGKLILTWIFLAPLASSFTRDSPHTLRAMVMLPMWQIIAAVGMVGIIRTIRVGGVIRGVIVVGYCLLVIVSLVNFWRVYFGSYRQQYSWVWQHGYKQAIQFIKENYDQYDRIIMTKKHGEPHEFVLFYWPWEPEKYTSDPNLVRYFRTNWWWVDGFDKFVFVNDWEAKNVKCPAPGGLNVKCLFIASPENYPEGWRKIETVNFLDGKPAFEILEF